MKPVTPTKFAPADRSSLDEILHDRNLIDSQALFREIFNSIASIAAIINVHRQIVYANAEFIESMGFKSTDAFLGARPGEVMKCVNADLEEGGCGTTDHCTYCGAVHAVLESMSSKTRVSRESRITIQDGTVERSLDLLVTATPLVVAGRDFTVITITDISGEKRKKRLERIFIHDLNDSLGGLHGILGLVCELDDLNRGREMIQLSEKTTADLLEEINSYRQITLAENGELQVVPVSLDSRVIMEEAVNKIRFHTTAKNRTLVIDPQSAPLSFVSDRSLLSRILVNMLKNAMEAVGDGETVTIGADDAGERIRFRVSNPGEMPRHIQSQIFQRSFSTKGNERGLGTYGMKLLGERYLGGIVEFKSSESGGTTFSITIGKRGRG